MCLLHTVDAFGAIFTVIIVVVIASIIVNLAIFVRVIFAHCIFHQNGARFIIGHFSEAKHPDVLQFAVMTPMGNHFVRIRTNEIAFQTVKM